MICQTLFTPTNSKNHHHLFTYIPQTENLYLWYAQPFSHQPIRKIYIYEWLISSHTNQLINGKNVFLWYTTHFILTNGKYLYLWYNQWFFTLKKHEIYFSHEHFSWISLNTRLDFKLYHKWVEFISKWIKLKSSIIKDKAQQWANQYCIK